jgi:hypothetical protein
MVSGFNESQRWWSPWYQPNSSMPAFFSSLSDIEWLKSKVTASGHMSPRLISDWSERIALFGENIFVSGIVHNDSSEILVHMVGSNRKSLIPQFVMNPAHEYTHRAIHSMTKNELIPCWLDEGTANFFGDVITRGYLPVSEYDGERLRLMVNSDLARQYNGLVLSPIVFNEWLI